MISLIRYPGSKAKLATRIVEMFPASIKYELWATRSLMEYREPFFGAGAVGFEVLPRLDHRCKVWLNDIDPHMVALWRAVLECPDELIKRCREFTPSAEWFYKFKAEDGDASLAVGQAGFRKLALHRMSFSGLGAKAGGPIGGKDQANAAYDVSCRWNPENIKNNVMKAHRLLRRFDALKITCGDFAPVVDDAPRQSFVYLDPPYYEKGPELYKHSMDDAMHQRLADVLRRQQCHWLLSYDEHPEIRRLYSWCNFTDLHVTYTTATAKANELRPKNREVVIQPPTVVCADVA